VVRGSRRAAAAKHSSGTAVIGPARRRRVRIHGPPDTKPERSCVIDHTRYPAHSGARRIVSTVRPISGPTGAILRSRPYSPNEKASTREIHGSWPRSIAIHVTPAAAVTTAAFINGVRRSPSRTIPNTTLTSGLM